MRSPSVCHASPRSTISVVARTRNKLSGFSGNRMAICGLVLPHQYFRSVCLPELPAANASNNHCAPSVPKSKSRISTLLLIEPSNLPIPLCAPPLDRAPGFPSALLRHLTAASTLSLPTAPSIRRKPCRMKCTRSGVDNRLLQSLFITLLCGASS